MVSKFLDWEISWINCDRIKSRGTGVYVEELRVR